jgi:hypothetical protein
MANVSGNCFIPTILPAVRNVRNLSRLCDVGRKGGAGDMPTKAIVAFLLGAVLAAGIVYYAVRQQPAVETAQTVVEPATVSEVPAADAPEVVEEAKPEPVPAATPREKAKRPSPTRRPSPVERQPVQVAENRQPATPAPVPPTQVPAPVATPEPAPVPASIQAVEPPKPEPRKPNTVTIPAGTLFTVRTDEELSTDKNAAGDTFRATLDSPVVVEGFVIAERGSRVQGRVVEVTPAGRVKGLARLSLELVSFTSADGQRVKVQTESFAREAQSTKKKDALKVGAAAGIGAAIGAIAGGGKGAAIGAGVGGAAGAGGVAATRGDAAELPSETRVSFRLAQPVTVTEKL